jgi:FADH2 O2-dependent halogenase
VYDSLSRADQIRPFKEEGDYSYAMSQIAGDRFVLVGDAARFVDPIFSSGVSIALNGARLASEDIVQALNKGDFTRDAFSAFETELKRGTRNWYRFIALYYRLNLLFTMFVRHPSYRTDVLKLLQGDLYDEKEPAVLVKMREIVTEIENNPRHVWHQLLGDLTDDTYRIDV